MLSANNIYSVKEIPTIKKVKLQAGHFKLENLHVEHGLILANLANQLPKVLRYKHGKKETETVLLTTEVNGPSLWSVIDKLTNIVLPYMEGIEDSKQKRPQAKSFSFI